MVVSNTLSQTFLILTSLAADNKISILTDSDYIDALGFEDVELGKNHLELDLMQLNDIVFETSDVGKVVVFDKIKRISKIKGWELTFNESFIKQCCQGERVEVSEDFFKSRGEEFEKNFRELSIVKQCKLAGIDRRTYYTRLARGDKDLFAPTNRKPRRSVPDHIKPLLEKNGIPNKMFFARLDKGWTEFEAANVLPNSDTCYYHNGKTVCSQLSKYKYYYFLDLINRKGMTPEEALQRLDNPVTSAKYFREGESLYSYCRKHGISYNKEYYRLKHNTRK